MSAVTTNHTEDSSKQDIGIEYSEEQLLESLLRLERQKYTMLFQNKKVNYDQLRMRLQNLEEEIAGLSTQENLIDTDCTDCIGVSGLTSQDEANLNKVKSVTSDSDSPSNQELELNYSRDDAELSLQSLDLHDNTTSLDCDDNVRRSSLKSNSSVKEQRHGTHTRMHRRLSVGSHPLYTMPNAFQYGIKMRDTKNNSISMFEEPTSPSLENQKQQGSTTPGDKRVQGSRERETNIRNITDSLNHTTDRSSFDLRRPRGSSTDPIGRVSFSSPVAATTTTGSTERKQRISSTDTPAGGGNSLAKVLLGGIGRNAVAAEEFDGDLTIDSVDAPKRHSLAELADIMEEDRELHGNEDREGSESNASSAPEGCIEFCIVEADWRQLHLQSQRGHLLTPLLPPRRSWRYPLDLEDSSENNTKELQDQSFFFPSGVKVDLVLPSVAALRSKSNKNIRHIVPFTDAQGKPTYACVLTVTQTYDVTEIAQLGDLILPNLVNINRQKQSAMCIQKCFRQYVAYKKMVTWQLHKAVNISKTMQDSPLQRSSTIFGRLSSGTTTVVKEHSRLDTSTHGSTGTGTGSTTDIGSTSSTTAPSRRTWSSFFTSARSQAAAVAESIDSSLHGTTTTGNMRHSTSTSTPGGENGKKTIATRSASVTATHSIGSAFSTPTAKRNRSTDGITPASATSTTNTTAGEVGDQNKSEAQRQCEQTTESQAEYIRRRVAVAQKAYCIISNSREYTYIFKVLDAIAAAEGFTDHRKQSTRNLPFSSTLSTDDDDSGEEGFDGRSSISSELTAGALAHSPTYTLHTNKSLTRREHSVENRSSPLDKLLTDREKSIDNLSNSGNNNEIYSPISKSSSLCAAMDAYYQQFRQKRDLQRNEFLVEIEFFLQEHFSTANLSTLDQIKTEFKIAPPTTATTTTTTTTTNMNNSNSRHKYLHNNTITSNSNAYNSSPILPFPGKLNNTTTSTTSNHNTNTTTSNNSNILNKTVLSSNRNTMITTKPSNHHSTTTNNNNNNEYTTEIDINNRFLHYHTILKKKTVYNIKIPDYIDNFRIDLKSLLTTKEWTCAVLFTHLNSTIIFKIINLLLMEKSLIIHGKNAGIVTTITMAVINLISPFQWEGIFIPLVPDNARELFGAPVPLIVGTTSAPRITDVSSDTAILFLNDDNVTITTYTNNHNNYQSTTSNSSNIQENTPKTSLKFVAWFVRLPEVSADLPLETEMTRRIDYTSGLLCDFIKTQLEYRDDNSFIHQNSGKYTTSKPVTSQGLTLSKTTTSTTTTSHIITTPIEKIHKITNTIDSLLMSAVPIYILQHIRILIVSIKRYNYGFCGCVISDPSSWKKFLRYSNRTGSDEFYPEYFMEPLRNHLEFQDAIVHTQLFVSFMDKLRKEQCVMDTFRRFIADWLYFRRYLLKKRQYLAKLQYLLDR